MGGGTSNLYHNTKGARAFFGPQDKTTDFTQGGSKADEKEARQPRYTETQGLREHITTASDGGRSGISGGHEEGAFQKKLDEMGGRVEHREPIKGIDGVEQVEYRLPKKDKTGEPTGEYQSKTHKKSVYDQRKISTDEYIKRGLEAANNAADKFPGGKLPREWTGKDSHGVTWRGYLGSDGNISSFFPDDEED